MKINSYRFGSMEIDGTAYTKDLIIASGKVHPNWFRKEGHIVALGDLEKWISENCKMLIIGTGAMGICKVMPELESYCKERSIELHVMRTNKAVDIFNMTEDKTGVIAGFHLTC